MPLVAQAPSQGCCPGPKPDFGDHSQLQHQVQLCPELLETAISCLPTYSPASVLFQHALQSQGFFLRKEGKVKVPASASRLLAPRPGRQHSTLLVCPCYKKK